MKKLLNKVDNETKSFLLSLLAVAFATLALASGNFEIRLWAKIVILVVSWALAIKTLFLAGKVYHRN